MDPDNCPLFGPNIHHLPAFNSSRVGVLSIRLDINLLPVSPILLRAIFIMTREYLYRDAVENGSPVEFQLFS